MAPPRHQMDTLLINGQLLTMDAQMSVQQAIAIRADRIQAVGDSESLRSQAHVDTHIIDLQGRTVIPGMIDVRAHLDREGLKNLQPTNWDHYLPPASLQEIGRARVAAAESVALRVPSAIIPQGVERNVLVNPQHSDFNRFQLIEITPFRFDERIGR